MNKIILHLTESLAKTLNILDPTKIKSTDNLKQDLGLDSMSSLIFLVNLLIKPQKKSH